MARSLDPLVVGRVIGDVVDMFNRVTEFTVRYGNKQVANGCDIKPSASANEPRVQILAPPLSSNLYTLVMVDPDAPSPSEPKYREWLHWIVVDIPEGSDATQGKELVPYMGPRPPTGIHRYVFVLFKQKNGAVMAGIRPPDARNNFRTRQFAAENDLGLPVAAVYFNSQREITVRKR
uniref:MOTHER OF FT AND TFL1 n=1 Tax=Litchi chinensis TaxID=151069 RepID=A0A7G9INK9_LITCN|nr:MOTHER OF FT AND TFL1 [Litchi chinensis]